MEIQLTIEINSISCKDTNQWRTMNSKRDNIEVLTYDNLDEVIEELFDLLRSRYQIVLETQMRGINFIFDCVICFVTNAIIKNLNVMVHILIVQAGQNRKKQQ